MTMKNVDYSDGLIQFPDALGLDLITYTVYDPQGRLVEITRKNPANHDSNDPMHLNPHYHFNLGSIVMFPDDIVESKSNNPVALENAKLGPVLTYIKNDYILSLNLPDSINYKNSRTEVVVQYTEKKNFTRTNIIYRGRQEI